MLVILLSYLLNILCCKVKTISFGDGPQCAQTLDKLLSSRIASNEFHNYLYLNNDMEGLSILEIYDSIKSFEIEINIEEGNLSHKMVRYTKKLIDRYINTMPIFPKEVQETINFRFEHQEINKTLFDQAYGIVINQLQTIYSRFIYTEYFKEMEKKLRKNEIICERYRKANLI